MDGVIEYRRLMESLPDDDRKLLLEQMYVFAQKYPEYEHLLPVRESIYKLNRLEGLQTSIRVQQMELGAINNEQLQAHLEKQALRGVNMAAEALGFGKNFYTVSSDIVKQFVNTPWANGKNFSTRIWDNADKLANYLNTDIAQGFARGDSYERLVKAVRTRFDKVSRNDAYRLIYTEGTYVMAESTMQPFQQDFDKYQISTVGDGKVCPICRAAAEQVYDIKDRRPGVNFPPFHTWCRCTFTIYVDDWDTWMDDYVKRHGGGEKQAETIANRFDSGIIKKNGDRLLKMNLQLFSESDIKRQESGSLKRAIRKYEKQIQEHEDKILHPERHINDWDLLDPRMQEGLKRHWSKEIKNFNQSIQDRIVELKERGDYDD